jgi:hypothetical protein
MQIQSVQNNNNYTSFQGAHKLITNNKDLLSNLSAQKVNLSGDYFYEQGVLLTSDHAKVAKELSNTRATLMEKSRNAYIMVRNNANEQLKRVEEKLNNLLNLPEMDMIAVRDEADIFKVLSRDSNLS